MQFPGCALKSAWAGPPPPSGFLLPWGCGPLSFCVSLGKLLFSHPQSLRFNFPNFKIEIFKASAMQRRHGKALIKIIHGDCLAQNLVHGRSQKCQLLLLIPFFFSHCTAPFSAHSPQVRNQAMVHGHRLLWHGSTMRDPQREQDREKDFPEYTRKSLGLISGGYEKKIEEES